MEQINKNEIQKLIDYQKQPCISIYIKGQQPSGAIVDKMRIKYKNLLADAERKLQEDWDFNRRESKKILQEAEKLTGELSFWQHQSKGMALFIGPGFLEYFKVSVDINKQLYINRDFNIIGILEEYFDDKQYLVLVLSKKSCQFYHVSKNNIDKIDVPGMPKTREEFIEGVKIEDEPRYTSHATGHASGTGSGQKAIFHGEEMGDDVYDDLMQKYFKKINEAIEKYVVKTTKPLILMCVENIFPAYQEISTYPQLVNDFVKGNYDNVTADKIKKLSQEKVDNFFEEQMSEKITEYHKRKNTEKSSSDLKEIVISSFLGKVDQLFIKKESSQPGKYNTEENEVVLANNYSKEYYDLYNFAAKKAFSTGAEIHFFPEEKMPDNTDIAAIFRF